MDGEKKTDDKKPSCLDWQKMPMPALWDYSHNGNSDSKETKKNNGQI